MRILYSYILLILFSLTATAQDVKVIAPDEVDVDTYFQLRYVVENADADNITLPSLSDFTVLSGPNLSSSSSMMINGSKMTQSKKTIFTYLLQPNAKGKFTIPSATLTVNGKKITAKQVKINVTGGSGKQASEGRQQSSASASPALNKITSKDLFVRATVSKKKVFEQEALLLTYRVYCRIGVQLNNAMLQKAPEFQGFVTNEVPISALDMHVETIDGEPFKCADYLSYVLFPQKSGSLSITPITIDCEVLDYDPTINPIEAHFNGRMRSRIFKCTSQALEVEVSPLPQPRPADFIGVVGEISMKGNWSTSNIHAQDPAHYQLTVSGKGNLNLMLPPAMTDTEAIEVYDVTPREELKLTANGYTGKVTYDYTLLPKTAGKTQLSALTASYYNTETGRYEQLTTGPIPLNALPSIGVASSPGATSGAGDIHTLQTGIHTMLPAEEYITWGNAGYLMLHLLILAIGGIALFLTKRYRGRDQASKKQRRALRRALRILKEAERSIPATHGATFHTRVLEAVNLYATEKFHLSRAALSRQAVEELLLSRGVHHEGVQRLLRIIDTCEYAKFAPPQGAGGLNDLLSETREALQLIDNEVRT